MGIIEYSTAVNIIQEIQSAAKNARGTRKSKQKIDQLGQARDMLQSAISKLPLPHPSYQFYLGNQFKCF